MSRYELSGFRTVVPSAVYEVLGDRASPDIANVLLLSRSRIPSVLETLTYVRDCAKKVLVMRTMRDPDFGMLVPVGIDCLIEDVMDNLPDGILKRLATPERLSVFEHYFSFLDQLLDRGATEFLFAKYASLPRNIIDTKRKVFSSTDLSCLLEKKVDVDTRYQYFFAFRTPLFQHSLPDSEEVRQASKDSDSDFFQVMGDSSVRAATLFQSFREAIVPDEAFFASIPREQVPVEDILLYPPMSLMQGYDFSFLEEEDGLMAVTSSYTM